MQAKAACSAAAKPSVSAGFSKILEEAVAHPRRHRVSIRLDEAGRRLSDPSLSARITDIAYDVGFDDLSYFSRSFRRKFGVSAREYRHSALRGTLPLWRGRPSS